MIIYNKLEKNTMDGTKDIYGQLFGSMYLIGWIVRLVIYAFAFAIEDQPCYIQHFWSPALYCYMFKASAFEVDDM